MSEGYEDYVFIPRKDWETLTSRMGSLLGDLETLSKLAEDQNRKIAALKDERQKLFASFSLQLSDLCQEHRKEVEEALRKAGASYEKSVLVSENSSLRAKVILAEAKIASLEADIKSSKDIFIGKEPEKSKDKPESNDTFLKDKVKFLNKQINDLVNKCSEYKGIISQTKKSFDLLESSLKNSLLDGSVVMPNEYIQLRDSLKFF